MATNPSDLELGVGNRLYVTPANQNVSGIMTVDATTGADLGLFGGPVSIYRNGLLEISPDGQTLYFANRGLSPGTAAKYDVSVSPPVLIYRNPHGDLGGSGQDLALSSDGLYLSYAVGGGNDGYVIYMMDATTDFDVLGTFVTGAYPREITYSPDSSTAFAVHTSGEIDVFSTTTFLPTDVYPTQGEAHELIVSHTGAYLLAAFDDEVRVYQTGLAVVDLPCDVETDAAGYVNGDVVSLTLSLNNPGTEALAVEWKTWLEVPDLGVFPLVNVGADGSWVLPAGFSWESGPYPIGPIQPSHPRGNWEIGCRVLDPVTGAAIFTTSQTFSVQ